MKHALPFIVAGAVGYLAISNESIGNRIFFSTGLDAHNSTDKAVVFLAVAALSFMAFKAVVK